jgi:DNA-binding CsgD family transcriptional regulator
MSAARTEGRALPPSRVWLGVFRAATRVHTDRVAVRSPDSRVDMRRITHLGFGRVCLFFGIVRSTSFLLTPRQREVLELVAAGATTKARQKEIANRLRISIPTVKWRVSIATKNLHCRSRAEAVAVAVARGYIHR